MENRSSPVISSEGRELLSRTINISSGKASLDLSQMEGSNEPEVFIIQVRIYDEQDTLIETVQQKIIK